jgi:transcriptional regulator with XRE-family HTH domain
MPGTLLELGKRIRKERQKRQLTLEDMSKKSNLSKSFLSQIERGIAEPSITSLKKIAACFGFSVVNLFPSDNGSEANWRYRKDTPEAQPQKPAYVTDVSVVRASKRKRLALPGSHVVYDLLTPDLNRQLEVMHMRVSQGEDSGEEPMLDSPGEKLCVVMKGRLEVRVGDELYRLEQGDSIYYPAHVPHSWRALDEDNTEVIWILTPPSF